MMAIRKAQGEDGEDDEEEEEDPGVWLQCLFVCFVAVTVCLT